MTSDPEEAGLKSAEQSMMGRRRVLSGVGGGGTCLSAGPAVQSEPRTHRPEGRATSDWLLDDGAVCTRVYVCVCVCVTMALAW